MMIQNLRVDHLMPAAKFISLSLLAGNVTFSDHPEVHHAMFLITRKLVCGFRVSPVMPQQNIKEHLYNMNTHECVFICSGEFYGM